MKSLIMLWLKAMYTQYDDDFNNYCMERYKRIQLACDVLGIVNDEQFEDFVQRNLDILYEDYLNSIDKTIH